MVVSKYTVTVDLARKHIEYDYDKSVYKADVIKLCKHIDDLQKKVKTFETIPELI